MNLSQFQTKLPADPDASQLRQLSDEVGRIATKLARLAVQPDASANSRFDQLANDGDRTEVAIETVRNVIHDRVLPALSVLTLAVISAAFTAVDLGPLALIAGTTLARLQFLQFYLASVIVTILPVTADLNERRRLFRALRSNKARYGILLENTTDILIHLKPDGTILYASPSITRLSGSQADKLINTNALALVGDEWRSHGVSRRPGPSPTR